MLRLHQEILGGFKENNTMSNLYVYLMRSRNKDIPNFNKRVKTDM